MRDYWRARAKWRQAAYDRAGDRVIALVRTAYDSAYRQLAADTEKILATYAADKGLTRAAALRMLRANAAPSTISRLQKEAAAITDPERRAELMRQLDAGYYAGRIARGDAIIESARVRLMQAADVQLARTAAALADIAADGYARTMYDMQRVAGYGFDLSSTSLRRVQSVLRENWSGKTFSARVWKNAASAADIAQKAVLEGVIAGKASAETWKTLVSQCDASVMAANRLLRTEINYTTGQAEMEAFTDAEIAKYRFTVVFDGRVCKRCADLDGKEFAVKDQRVGVNMHPLHPFCRCGVEPILPFAAGGGQRWARRISDGQAEKIKPGITYKEWRAKSVKE